jgi:predicted lipoprotein with Yx(FWY)xxD motif
VAAGDLAKPVEDWSPIARPDGSKQWAFKGFPLYVHKSKSRLDDGVVRSEFGIKWRPAIVRSYFTPPQVTVRKSQRGWTALVTVDGKTLYARDQFRYSYGGFSVNDGPPASPQIGRSIGASGCNAECSRTWVPLSAPPEAQPAGYWSIVERSGGTRQWAYQGYPLYTYANDKAPGDMIGRNTFEITDGAHATYWRVATP